MRTSAFSLDGRRSFSARSHEERSSCSTQASTASEVAAAGLGAEGGVPCAIADGAATKKINSPMRVVRLGDHMETSTKHATNRIALSDEHRLWVQITSEPGKA